MAYTSPESQKQRYSQELAAYTLRQWNSARQSIERQSQDSDGSKSNKSSPPAHMTEANGTEQGTQAVDYARRSRRRCDDENYRQQEPSNGRRH
ncbi:hypothetical protein JAAARDRAFT_37860 [Jaapia argillacea MUCL 33604]|uniref:Uncharacterized protein n=1 Tax=Jaapia argillacea MUCL 33604 TaxID=933084 RepID=A0A067PWP2_9AGAM|nr:hypothetical protein JAAARDRAFT_37860 [Jaapia argillacea MUCL 33604]